MARGGRRRALDEEPKAERRLSPAHERDRSLNSPAGEVLRLQTLAGNTAVNTMMRSAAIQRDEGKGPAPADTKEKPKQSAGKVTLEGLGEFDAKSFSHSVDRPGGGAPKKDEPTKVVVTKEADDLSAKLHQASVEGTKFSSVTIDFGGAKLVLKNVYISSFQLSGGGGGEAPTESLGFDAEEAKWEFKEPPSGGGDGGY